MMQKSVLFAYVLTSLVQASSSNGKQIIEVSQRELEFLEYYRKHQSGILYNFIRFFSRFSRK